MTTSSSIKVKARRAERAEWVLFMEQADLRDCGKILSKAAA
jgi:hypothetical protein